jgi:NADH dehydrogenase FAD-containing subunit
MCALQIVGEVRAVRKDCVLIGLEELRFDYLVVATGLSLTRVVTAFLTSIHAVCCASELIGSHYPSNIKGTSVTASYRGKQLMMERKRLEACKSVLIIGGGVVGVEMSFEIKQALPHVEVTVIHSKERFLIRLPASAHEKVAKEYDKLGVKYVLNERVVKFDDKEDSYITDKGRVLKADRAYWCGGPMPLTAYVFPQVFLSILFADACCWCVP